ncbi:MAG: methylated-DNA--[protein]-cysteine S-methyltransferase [Actinomycetota bacterium]|nr:methylated-DNA--[protein]-cysteine S-methyltransferase [Actinomycetota bacterium]
MHRYTTTTSPVGELLLLAGDEPDSHGDIALTGVYLPDHKGAPLRDPAWRRDDAAFATVVDQLRAYFAGERTTFDLPLAGAGTAFQRRVWAALRDIPYGETISYGELARRVGGSPRAVGTANGRNPLSIVVPCHRVVAGSGALTGYAGGLDAKRALLAHEAALSRTRLW